MYVLPNAAGRLLAVVAAVMISEQLLASAVDFDGSSYARNTSLNADLDVYWTIDEEAETIRVAVHAKAAAGWAGVGVSEMGGMEGADIVFYEAAVRHCFIASHLAAEKTIFMHNNFEVYYAYKFSLHRSSFASSFLCVLRSVVEVMQDSLVAPNSAARDPIRSE